MHTPSLTKERSLFGRVARIVAAWFVACLVVPVAASETPDALFQRAAKSGAIGKASKTKTVDAKSATVGEVVITMINKEEETRSRPAEAGDMVVRNRCDATGNEQYLVKGATFAERYRGPEGPADAEGWRPYAPKGKNMLYILVKPEDGDFTFTAPWGEQMIARPGDALVRDPTNPNDTYRVAAASFACTYEVTKEAR